MLNLSLTKDEASNREVPLPLDPSTSSGPRANGVSRKRDGILARIFHLVGPNGPMTFQFERRPARRQDIQAGLHDEHEPMSKSYSELREGLCVDWDVAITMDDGLVLRADVFRP